MKCLEEIDKPILILLVLVVVQIVCFGICALTGTWQQRTALLTTVVVPLLVALPGLWKFKYWAWLVAVIVVCYNLMGLLFVVLTWSEHVAFYQRHHGNLLKVAYMLVISHVINLIILILLLVDRSYFDE